MRSSKNLAIDADSNEYNAMFTPDGKLDFKARVGMSRDEDPLNRVDFKLDPRDGRVEFQEHQELRESAKSNYQSNRFAFDNDDDDDGFNGRW